MLVPWRLDSARKIVAAVSVCVVAFAVATGCGEGPGAPKVEPATRPALHTARGVSNLDADLQQLARSVAIAMGDEQVRMGAKAAWRASPFSEHKLILQEYLATSAGARLLDRVARQLNEMPSRTLARLGMLPRLEFYVPFTAQRMSWLGAPVIVGATDAGSQAYTVRTYDA